MSNVKKQAQLKTEYCTWETIATKSIKYYQTVGTNWHLELKQSQTQNEKTITIKEDNFKNF